MDAAVPYIYNPSAPMMRESPEAHGPGSQVPTMERQREAWHLRSSDLYIGPMACACLHSGILTLIHTFKDLAIQYTHIYTS